MHRKSTDQLKRWLTAVWVFYGLVWIALEGSRTTVVLMGIGTTTIALLHLAQRLRGLGKWQKVVGLAAGGGIGGLAAVGLTLIFMSVKTGLHAHGPEFSAADIGWVIDQSLLWTIVGGLLGGGLGLIFAGVRGD